MFSSQFVHINTRSQVTRLQHSFLREGISPSHPQNMDHLICRVKETLFWKKTLINLKLTFIPFNIVWWTYLRFRTTWVNEYKLSAIVMGNKISAQKAEVLMGYLNKCSKWITSFSSSSSLSSSGESTMTCQLGCSPAPTFQRAKQISNPTWGCNVYYWVCKFLVSL